MSDIRRIVLDVLKPHEPSIVEFAETLEDIGEVEGVNLTLVEIDEEVQNIKITLEGSQMGFDEIKAGIENLGGSVHSVDEIACGERIVEKISTPQD